MSQFWHAHWAEDSFKPSRLQNWEVPRWHAQWPDKHCTTSKFVAHKNGRLFATANKSNPWSDFKGTWELPLKIDRSIADTLSKSTEFKKSHWNVHKIKHQHICNKKFQELTANIDKSKNNRIEAENKKQKKDEQANGLQNVDSIKIDHTNEKYNATIERCNIKETCIL